MDMLRDLQIKVTFNGGVKNKNNKLMSLRINDDKLLEKYTTIWARIEDSKDIELDALLVYGDRVIDI